MSTFIASDKDGGTSSDFKEITVNAPTVNAPPVAANDTATTNKNTAVAVNVLANDSDPDGTLNATTVAIVGPAGHGTTSVDATTGVVTYTPAVELHGPR